MRFRSFTRYLLAAALAATVSAPAHADGFPDEPPPAAKKKPDPRTKRQIHSQASLKVLPIEGSQRNTGSMVWQVMGGEDEFAKAPERLARAPAPEIQVLKIPTPGVAPVPSELGPVVYPNPTPRPSLVPEYDFYGEPALDRLIASSIPANAEDVPAIDPDRFFQTPIALDMTGATIDEVMRKLVPPRYRVRIDVRPEVRERRDNVLMETSLKSAFAQLEAIWGVKIYPYHKLQVVLVTDLKELQ